MLAKIWKKLLLAICIVACLFNITSKLVNRTSLEVNLESANDGNTVFDFTREDSSVDATTDEITANTDVTDETSTETNSQEETEVDTDETIEEEETEETTNSSKAMKYQDITWVEL